MSSIEIQEFVATLPKESQERLTTLLTQLTVIPPKEFSHLMSSGPYPTEVMWRQLSVQQNMNKFLFPLSSKTISFVQQLANRDNGDNAAQFPFLTCAVLSLIVRILAIIATQAYIQVTGARDQEVNLGIVKILRNPTDNQWLMLSNKLLTAALKSTSDDNKNLQAFIGQIVEILKQPALLTAEEKDQYHIFNLSNSGKQKEIKTITDTIKFLLRFRNDLIHAHPLTDDHITGAGIAMLTTLQALLPVTQYHLATKINEEYWQLSGRHPKRTQTFTGDIIEKTLVLCDNDGPILPLSPLMTLAQNIQNIDEKQDVFFINAGSLNRLNYIGFVNSEQHDGHNLGTYEQFKKYMAQLPTPSVSLTQIRINFDDYAEEKSRYFVGRTDLLKEIETAVQQDDGRYLILKALAGMGKSAIIAQLYNRHNEPYNPNASQKDKVTGDLWVFHFCMHTKGRDSALVTYRSLIAQVQQGLGIYKAKNKLPTDIKELKELFQNQVNSCADKLQQRGGNKLVIVIDALDESLFVDEDNILSCIPTLIHPHVVFLLSYRVNNANENQKVEQQLETLPNEKKTVLKAANPLNGLNKEDVSEFVQLANKGTVKDDVFEEVWKAASQDGNGFADPFFLRFVIDGVEKKQFSLARKETIPKSLDAAFEKMWISLPPDKDFLAHRLLLNLGIMRDFGDDELFAELFSRQNPEQTFSVEDIAAQRIKTGKLLIYDGDRYSLFHDRFRHFLVGEQKDPIDEAMNVGRQQ
jgi:hypothetical protein